MVALAFGFAGACAVGSVVCAVIAVSRIKRLFGR